MRIGRGAGHTLALAAPIIGAFAWRKADIARVEAGLDALRDRVAGVEAGQTALEAGLARTNERVARLEGAVGAVLGRLFPPAAAPDAGGANMAE